MNKLLTSLVSAVALALPLSVMAQAAAPVVPAMPAAPAAPAAPGRLWRRARLQGQRPG